MPKGFQPSVYTSVFGRLANMKKGLQATPNSKDSFVAKMFERIPYGTLTLDFTFWSSECRFCGMIEVLQASVGVFQEGFGRSPGESARLQESLLLFLVLVY